MLILPLYDNMPDDERKTGTLAILFLSLFVHAVVFVVYVTKGEAEVAFLQFGLVPDRATQALLGNYGDLYTYITHMFLHDGFLHLFTNLYLLYLCGKTIEARMGTRNFILFYIVCGIASGAAYVGTSLDQGLPAVGASGAIAGLLSAYLLLVPHARIDCFFLFIPIIARRIAVPAYIIITLWFAAQSAMALIDPIGIVWQGHIAGFLAGLLLCPVFKLRDVSLLTPLAETGTRAAWIATRRRQSPDAVFGEDELEQAWLASLIRDDPMVGAKLAKLSYRVKEKLEPPFDGPMALGKDDPDVDRTLRKAARLLVDSFKREAPGVAGNCADHLRLNLDKVGSAIWHRIRWLANELVDAEFS